MGKTLARVIKSDIKEAGGVLQTCTGIESGLEASIHAMSNNLESEEQTYAVLQVDADNALNRLTGRQHLQNILLNCK